MGSEMCIRDSNIYVYVQCECVLVCVCVCATMSGGSEQGGCQARWQEAMAPMVVSMSPGMGCTFCKLRGVHYGARRRGTSNWSTFCPTNHAAVLAAPWQVVMLPALRPTLVAAAAVAVLGTEGSADAKAASWSALPDAWLSHEQGGASECKT